MTEIKVIGGRIFIRELVLEDKDAALVLSDLEAAKREETTLIALRLGFLMYGHGRIGVNVDFVRREFDQVVSGIKEYWQNEVAKKLNETIDDHFHPQKGTIPRKLAEYFGDAGSAGKLADLFDEKRTTSVPYQLRQIIQKELSGENSAFVQALNPDDDKTPIGKLRKKIEEPIRVLNEKIIEKRTAEAVAEKGTQKGGAYEDLTFGYIDRIAATFGDVPEDVSAQNAPGDYVVTLDAEAVPGQILKIAIDAKDTGMGLRQCESVLADAKAKWDAQAALLVFARQDETPFGAPTGFRRLTQGYVCVFDKDTLDAMVLQVAYQIVRLEAIRSVQCAVKEVDAALVQRKLEEAIQKLQDFATLKRRLTAAIKDLGAVREFVSSLRDEIRDLLEEAWTSLGIKAPMPVLPEEHEAA